MTSSKSGSTPRLGGEPTAEDEVLSDVQVREQAAFLKDIADAPPMARNGDVLLGVEQRPSIDDDPAARSVGSVRRWR